VVSFQCEMDGARCTLSRPAVATADGALLFADGALALLAACAAHRLLCAAVAGGWVGLIWLPS
jgi:hypothetical protein